jgi:transposase
LVTRTDPSEKNLKKHFKKDKDGDHVRKLNVIRLMRKLKNTEQVAELLAMAADTILQYVEVFNSDGLEELFKKKRYIQDSQVQLIGFLNGGRI